MPYHVSQHRETRCWLVPAVLLRQAECSGAHLGASVSSLSVPCLQIPSSVSLKTHTNSDDYKATFARLYNTCSAMVASTNVSCYESVQLYSSISCKLAKKLTGSCCEVSSRNLDLRRTPLPAPPAGVSPDQLDTAGST